MDAWVIDWETLSNCSMLVAENYATDETKVFVIHELVNDFLPLVYFFRDCRDKKDYHISFNGLAFDAQITEWILKGAIPDPNNGDDIARRIYKRAQHVIQLSNAGEFQEFSENKMQIPQIDVFKTNHWDNANKRSSLKWIQFSIDWPNVQEMPISHTYEVKTLEEIEIIKSYCINDVKSTKKVFQLSKPLLTVRQSIKRKYKLDCLSYSNTRLGSELLLKLYCNFSGQESSNVRYLRTNRTSIKVSEIIFPYISFQTSELQEFFEMVKKTIIYNTRDGFSYELNYKGVTFYYGMGGIHQCIEAGIYKADDRFIIKDFDVASLYPSIACVNEMFPAHLGKTFFKVYKENIVDVRLAEKRKTENKDMAIIEGFKEAANATYG